MVSAKTTNKQYRVRLQPLFIKNCFFYNLRQYLYFYLHMQRKVAKFVSALSSNFCIINSYSNLDRNIYLELNYRFRRNYYYFIIIIIIIFISYYFLKSLRTILHFLNSFFYERFRSFYRLQNAIGCNRYH